MRQLATPPKEGDSKKSADYGTSGPNRSGDDDDDCCGRSVSSLTTVPVSNVDAAAVLVTPGSARASRTKKMADRHRRGGGLVVPPPPSRAAAQNRRLGELKGQLDGLPGLRELRRQLGEAHGWIQQLLQQHQYQHQLPAGKSEASEQPGDATEGQYLRDWLQQQRWLASMLELELGETTRPLLHSVEGWIRPCLEKDASCNQEATTTTLTTLTQGGEEERRARTLLQEEQRVLVRKLQARVEAIHRGLSQVDLLMQELRLGANDARTIADERAGQQDLFLRILQALDEILGTADDDEGTGAGPIGVVYAGSGSHATMSTVTGHLSEAGAIRGGVGGEEEDEEDDEEGEEDEKGAAPLVTMDAGSHAFVSTVTLTSKGGRPDKRKPGGSGGS
jgi:hypothetical protein